MLYTDVAADDDDNNNSSCRGSSNKQKTETPLQNGVGSTVDKVEKLRKENHFFSCWRLQQQQQQQPTE